MGVLVILMVFFVCQVMFGKSQITIPFTSWSCNSPQNELEPLSKAFSKSENSDLLSSCKTKLDSSIMNDIYKNTPIIPTPALSQVIPLKPTKGIQTKQVDKTVSSSAVKPALISPNIPNLVTTKNLLSIQNLSPNEKITPQVLPFPLTELSKLGTNNALSTKYSDINNSDPRSTVASLNKLTPLSYTENLSTNKDLKSIRQYSVSEPPNKFSVNGDISRIEEHSSDCNARRKIYVPLTALDVKQMDTVKPHTLFSQFPLTDGNRNKIPSDTTPPLAVNFKENLFATAPNILSDTVLPNLENLSTNKDSNYAKLNYVPVNIKTLPTTGLRVNGDKNCAKVYNNDGNTERNNYNCILTIPTAITSDEKQIEIPKYETLFPQFLLQDDCIYKQQSGNSPIAYLNTIENLITATPNILVNAMPLNVEKFSVNRDTNSEKLNYISSPTTLQTASLIINDDLNCVKAYNLQGIPVSKTIITSDENKIGTPISQICDSQFLLSNENKNKIQTVTSAGLAGNMKNDLVSALPNILADATIKALNIDSPLLISKGVDATSNLLKNYMQNVNSKIANVIPTIEKAKENSAVIFSEPTKNMAKLIIPNLQMNVMPIINNNMAPVTQVNLKSFEFKNENNYGDIVKSLQIPEVSNVPATPSVPSELSEIANFGLQQLNKPYVSPNFVSIPYTSSSYIGPVSVPPDPSVYKTWSDKYTNCLRNSLNQFVSVLTSNILSTFRENFNIHTSPVTKSGIIPSSVISQRPIPFNLPEFALDSPPIESPKSLPRPKLDLPKTKTSSIKILPNTEKINQSTASSQPYISSITINLTASKDTTNNIIIMI